MRQFLIGALALSFFACQQSPSEPSTQEQEVEEIIEVETTEESDASAHDHHSMAGETSMDPESEYLVVPEDARVFFVNLTDGQAVPNKLKVVMGVEGMEVQPAGELVAGTGHHHILVDGKFMAKGQFIPKDENHIHFGDGQTEAEIELASGEHTLTLQFANGAHFSYGEQMSTTITVTAP